jgi:HK97 family phage portal protein
MNRIEKFLHSIGRLRGVYAKGLDMAFSDPNAWRPSGYINEGRAKSHKPEDPAEALAYYSSWTYICSSLNARACASVPLRLYGAVKTRGSKIKWAGTDVPVPTRPVSKARRKQFEATRSLQPYLTKAVDVEEITEHPFLDLIQNVNPFSNMSDLMELTVTFMDLTGSAYWYLVRNGAGVPEAIWSVPSQYMTPIPGKTLDTFITGYKFTRGQTDVTLPIEDVLMFAYPNPKNQLIGFSPVLGVADAVYNSSQMKLYEASIFTNKAMVDGVFTVDATVPGPQAARAQESFSAEYAGMMKAGKRPILPPGMKFEKATMTSVEIESIERSKMTREEIAASLDVPMSLLDPNSIRSNVDGAQLFHARFGLAPRLRKIEERINERLIPMYDSGNGIFAAFDSCVPEDLAFQLEQRKNAVGGPWLSADEARAEEGRDALDLPGWSDVPLVSGLVVPMGTEPPPPAPNPFATPPVDPNADADATAKDLADRTMKILKETLGA